jgi:cell division protein FtsB
MFHIIDLMEREARTHGDVTIRTNVLRDWTAQLRAELGRLYLENEALKAQVVNMVHEASPVVAKMVRRG